MLIYYVNLSSLRADAEREAALALLPAWRRERALSMRDPAARSASVGAGLLYRFGLRALGADPEVPVTVLPAGKPVLAARADLWFSLSHSGPWALAAFSRTRVGADVQELRPWKESILRRLCAQERDFVAALPEDARQSAFFRLWARKESWVKAASAERILRLDEQSVLGDEPPWRFADWVLPDGAAAAVCAEEAQLPEKPKELCIQELLE